MTNKQPEAGLYESDPQFTFPCLHQSIATVLVNRSPLHAFWKAFWKMEEEYNETTTRGQIAHSLLLGGRNIEVITADDWRTKEARELRELARQNGKLPILQSRRSEAKDLLDSVLVALKSYNIALAGQSEITAVWQSLTGVWCQGTLDHLILPPPNHTRQKAHIYDFKFVNCAAKKVCENKFLEYGYDIQAAAYTQAIETIFPELAGRVEITYIFAEVEPPYAVRLMPLAGSMRRSGEWRWGQACDKWAGCLEAYGTETPWPAYADDGEPAEVPAWAMNAQVMQAEIEERMESNEVV